jgi:hypothetical protein
VPTTYEVCLEPDPAILAEFDPWLETHVREMLRLPGFTGASIHRAEEPGTGRPQRVVRYRVHDRAALERYFREQAATMRAAGLERFGDRFTATRRVIEAGAEAGAEPPETCANCGAPLRGQYCSMCGQRARVRMITLWELLQDAGDLLASLDSRLWRTLGLLFFRPGRLTLDYLQGRRARYVAPFRLFIAASLIFFFLAGIEARFDLGDGGPVIRGDPAPVSEPAPPVAEPDAAPADVPEPAGRSGIFVNDDMTLIDEECRVDYTNVPAWLSRLLPAERAQQICLRIKADRGQTYLKALMSNLPAMMFFFMPVMALLMKLAYPLSGRYYAEHLLFLVHYHSFFYLSNTILVVAWWAADFAAGGSTLATLLTTVVWIYLPVYLFRAMRRVYGQGFLATAFKYILLTAAYFTCLVLTFIGLITYTALTL